MVIEKPWVVATTLVLVEKGNFSDTILDKSEKVGDGEVIGEMEGPSSVAAMAAAVVVKVTKEWWRTTERRGYLVVVGGVVVVSGRHYRSFDGQIRLRQLAENGEGYLTAVTKTGLYLLSYSGALQKSFHGYDTMKYPMLDIWLCMIQP
ncbi:hypothetical protein RND71_015038 [Anisodus tanguticus]|uniref:Uncharacterized protein n=1 Tax=Anisodus tanguticus TaxID=243964 RepID=A0AAE1SD13_9SOLA|nr:hypothetical protein RND71_015038 [Anisodus tanguticus]